MRFSSLLPLLAFATSALAYEVTFPTRTRGWTNEGAQNLTWTRSGSDRWNFSIVLINSDGYSQMLAAEADGRVDPPTMRVNPPATGWPLGEGFRVNLCQDSENTDVILARSAEFLINETRTGATVTPQTTPRPTPISTNPASGSSPSNSPGTTNDNAGASFGPGANALSVSLVGSLAVFGAMLI